MRERQVEREGWKRGRERKEIEPTASGHDTNTNGSLQPRFNRPPEPHIKQDQKDEGYTYMMTANKYKATHISAVVYWRRESAEAHCKHESHSS